jgi:hypothetical protein
MERLRRALRPWVLMSAVWSGAVFALLLVEHQQLRLQANDPQVQLAEDAAARIDAGAPAASVLPPAPAVDIGRSLAPFVAVYDAGGVPVASSGSLHGAAPRLPMGVFRFARARGGHRLSWQPEAGLRQALVVAPLRAGGYVLAGRSLREAEARKAKVMSFLGLLWGAGLVGLALLALAWPGRVS